MKAGYEKSRNVLVSVGMCRRGKEGAKKGGKGGREFSFRDTYSS